VSHPPPSITLRSNPRGPAELVGAGGGLKLLGALTQARQALGREGGEGEGRRLRYKYAEGNGMKGEIQNNDTEDLSLRGVK